MPRRGNRLTQDDERVRLLAGCIFDCFGIGLSICVLGMLTKWFHTTRLETRTKESNMYASIWVKNPRAE